MTDRKSKILTVDDEPFNLDLLQVNLEEAGFEVLRAEDGTDALELLNKTPDIDLIVLDRMMPKMDGMTVTRKLKGDPKFRDIPIIMQTAAGHSQQMQEGLEAGVFYYLIKPYNESLLISVVKNVLQHRKTAPKENKPAAAAMKLYGLMEHASVRFRTLQDVSVVAGCIAHCCPKPDAVAYGLTELMINAVEHGNLGLSYAEKQELVMEDGWQKEVERRLALPENKDKYARLTFEAGPQNITITIKDQGKGFKWQSYVDFDPIRLAEGAHGKGIAIAKVTSFPTLEYRAGGTEVVCRVPLPEAA